MPQYAWRKSYRSKVSAEVAGMELERIANENEGVATAEAIYLAGSRKGSALYPCFEHDTRKAAYKWNLHLARNLSCALRIIDDDGTQQAPAFVNVIVQDDEGDDVQGYMTAGEAMSDENLREYVLDEARKMLNAFRRRFGHLREFRGVVTEIDKAVNE